MDELYNQLIAFAQAHGYGTAVGIVLGMIAPRFIPQLRAIATKTPSKVDDMVIAGLAACLEQHKENIAALTVVELDKLLTDGQVIELAKMRKARWASAKLQAAAPAGAKS